MNHPIPRKTKIVRGLDDRTGMPKDIMLEVHIRFWQDVNKTIPAVKAGDLVAAADGIRIFQPPEFVLEWDIDPKNPNHFSLVPKGLERELGTECHGK